MIIGKKAQWLKGDRFAWINTKNKPIPSLMKYEIEIRDYVDDRALFGSRRVAQVLADNMTNIWFTKSLSSNNLMRLDLLSIKSWVSVTPTFPATIIADVYNGYYICNGDLVNVDVEGAYSSQSPYEDALFAVMTGNKVDNRIYNGAIGKFKIYKEDSLLKSFIPIKLTTDIPAILASDNLPHESGECGMWEEVNQLFYGNAHIEGKGHFSVNDLTEDFVETRGICINNMYQSVFVDENIKIPKIVLKDTNTKQLVLNNEVVWDSKICEVEIYKWLYSDENNPTRVDVGAFDLSQISKIQYAESSTGITKTAGTFDWGNTTFGRRYNRPSFTIFLNNNQLGGGTAGSTFNVDEVILDRENNKAILKRHSYGVKTCIKGEFSGDGWVNTNVEKALFTNLGETGIVGFRPQYSVIVFFKIWDLAGNLIHEFRPCKLLGTLKSEKSYDSNKHYSGELGLFDLCNNKFYPNCVEDSELTLDFIIKGVNESNTERQEKIKSIYI